MMFQYEAIPQYENIQPTEGEWMREFSKDDGYLKIITKGDKVYSYLKFDRKTNYKVNLENSLGVLENPMTFGLLSQTLTTLGFLSQTTKDLTSAIKSVEDLRIQKELWKKTMIEIDYKNRHDSQNQASIDTLERVFDSVIAVVIFANSILSIQTSKLEGDDLLKELLTSTVQLEPLMNHLKHYSESSSADLSLSFIETLLVSTLFTSSLEILSEVLKAVVPSSKKKKKGANPTLDQVNQDLIGSLKQAIKDASSAFGNSPSVDLQERNTYLSDQMKQANEAIKGPHEELIAKKVQEIAKEEKLARDRLRDMRGAISKKLKEISATGVFA